MRFQTTWTREREDELRRLICTERLTARQAADALGLTKNTVIGKCWRARIALPPDPRTFLPEQVREIRESTETSVALARRLGVSTDAISRVRNWHTHRATPNPFPDLSGCLWGDGDPAKPGFHFCGDSRAPGKPYCSAHATRAYRRRDAAVEALP